MKIREDIATFYVNNRADIGNRDLLTLLSFANRQEHVLRTFGVDTTVVTELSKDLLLQYTNTTQTLMRQWMARIAEADEKSELKLIQPTAEHAALVNAGVQSVTRGQITHWPEDLIKCISTRAHPSLVFVPLMVWVIGEQLMLVRRELEDEARDSISLLIVRLLIEFPAKLKTNLDQIAKRCQTYPQAIERTCAYVNNFRRFTELLKDSERVRTAFVLDRGQ